MALKPNFVTDYKSWPLWKRLVVHTGETAEYKLNGEGYYAECGRYKPWTMNSVNAAVKRGLVLVVKRNFDCDIVWTVPTEAGLAYYRAIMKEYQQ